MNHTWPIIFSYRDWTIFKTFRSATLNDPFSKASSFSSVLKIFFLCHVCIWISVDNIMYFGSVR